MPVRLPLRYVNSDCSLSSMLLIAPGWRQSKEVANSYDSYLSALGEIEKSYKESIQKETKVLRELDDILSELAMIRRVQEELRSVAMDWWEDRYADIVDDTQFLPIDRWTLQGKNTLKGLEGDAERARQSVSSHPRPYAS